MLVGSFTAWFVTPIHFIIIIVGTYFDTEAGKNWILRSLLTHGFSFIFFI